MGNAAYDFSRFGAAAPQEREEQQRREIYEIRRVRKQLKNEARRSARASAKVVIISAALFALFATLMYCRVQLNELNDKYTSLKNEIMIAESDNVRLNMELDSKASIYSIDDYAVEELSMHKITDNQINYVDLSDDGNLELQAVN